MSNQITLGVKLLDKLQDALDRNNIPDLADLDWLASGDNIVLVRRMRLGDAEITIPDHFTKGVILPARTQEFVPKTAFMTDKRVWGVRPCMSDLIFPLSKPQPSVPALATLYRDLTDKMIGWDIIKEYPQAIYRDASILLAHLDGLISLQVSGEVEEDSLVGNYYRNLFFLVPDDATPHVGFVVSACWHPADYEWHFFAAPLDGRDYHAGCRVIGTADTET